MVTVSRTASSGEARPRVPALMWLITFDLAKSTWPRTPHVSLSG
jgi:hypothetical protein